MKVYRIIIILFSIPAILLFVKVHIFSVSNTFRKHPVAEYSGNLALHYSLDEFNNEFTNRTINPIDIQQPLVTEVDAILIGDSYSKFYDGNSIYEYLTEVGHKVCNYNPFELNASKEKKYVFLICGKITLSSHFFEIIFNKYMENSKPIPLKKRFLEIVFTHKAEKRYNLIINRSVYTLPFMKQLKTIRNKIFDERAREVIYIDKPSPILHNKNTVNALKRNKTTITKYLNANTQEILKLEKNLNEKGYELFVVIAPLKAEIRPIKQNAGFINKFKIVEQTLTEAGLNVIDATPILQQIGPSSYTRTDSHWSSVGMKAVADTLSNVIISYQTK